ncbi:hypothetical protein IID19_02515 [Patescibacteria group bacterium]|nr:hypothetical protein [Patescibacteria group bacterium]
MIANIIYTVIFLIMITVSVVSACDPPIYLLFHEDAANQFDSLNVQPTDSNLFDRVILSHNLAFNDDSKQRETSEELLKYFVKDSGWTYQAVAYSGALKMLKERDRGPFGTVSRKLITGFGLFGSGPKKEAKKGFYLIRESIQQDSSNIQLRILGLSAAVEVAEHIHELLPYAYRDLKWLGSRLDQLDSSEVFFYRLSWAKYAYKYALIHRQPSEAIKGLNWVSHAEKYACRPVYQQEVDLWRSKINNLINEIKAESE